MRKHPQRQQVAPTTTNEPNNCSVSDLTISFFPATGTRVSVGDIVGFTINSSSSCANQEFDVDFTEFDSGGAFVGGILFLDVLNSDGSLTLEYRILQQNIDDQSTVGIETSPRFRATGEVIGTESWLYDV